jgi:hypothetical protein
MPLNRFRAASPPQRLPGFPTGTKSAGGRSQISTTSGGRRQEAASTHEFLDLQQYYGEWYYNAADHHLRMSLLRTSHCSVLIDPSPGPYKAVLASHFMTLFNLGWGWLFILLASCSTYYTTSMARVRQRARDDIQRELVKTRLASEHESADWMNNFLDRFWLIYEPVLSATIVAFVDQTLSTNCPPFLESLRLTQFTLGNKAPRMDKVRTFPKTAEDEVLMDWGFSFTPNDVSDLTPRQLATKSNPKDRSRAFESARDRPPPSSQS